MKKKPQPITRIGNDPDKFNSYEWISDFYLLKRPGYSSLVHKKIEVFNEIL